MDIFIGIVAVVGLICLFLIVDILDDIKRALERIADLNKEDSDVK
jgi:hypothetical protein